MEQTRIYRPKDIVVKLNISDGCLRKWCLELEKHGYAFRKSGKYHKRRIFSENDLRALRKFQKLKNSKVRMGSTIAQIIVKKYKNDGSVANLNKQLHSMGKVDKSFLQLCEEINDLRKIINLLSARSIEQEVLIKRLSNYLKMECDVES
ncbi:hypothetical protein COI60_25690 [Bacillus toyonensis]|uniref:hypothetical protein n=1 Tax=Bacillus toyonensis TaxID=155322 RepID=UPI000BFBFDAA|nr:hypothetical protein [Bacillus toyonensis]PHG29974.1 hypothetical protein COI60_25690 [Bacillus toyonensis]